MSDEANEGHIDETSPSEHLSEEEVEAVVERKAGSARVVHEVVRLQGQEELRRPPLSLLFSAFAGGCGIAVSVLAQSFLRMRLPDTPAMELVSGLGYSVGFIIVILGKLQLFTETTVTAVLPVATHPHWRNAWRMVRLWTIVLLGNIAGTLFAAAIMTWGGVLSSEQLTAAIDLSSHLQRHDALHTMLAGMPAGFLIGCIAWMLPNARFSEFWVILLVTYVIAIGNFSHVVAGSVEAWLLWLGGRASLGWVVGGFILPAFLGNVIGGTGLFALLAHGQVRSEI